MVCCSKQRRKEMSSSKSINRLACHRLPRFKMYCGLKIVFLLLFMPLLALKVLQRLICSSCRSTRNETRLTIDFWTLRLPLATQTGLSTTLLSVCSNGETPSSQSSLQTLLQSTLASLAAVLTLSGPIGAYQRRTTFPCLWTLTIEILGLLEWLST